MTTIILATKLCTNEHNKIELDKLKSLKVVNMQEKIKAAKFLRNLHRTQKKSCRLCLRPGENNIFDNKVDYNIAENIKIVLNIEIDKDDVKPQHICTSCENIVQQAVQLKQTAENTQWRLQQEIELISETNLDNHIYNQNEDYNTPKQELVNNWSCNKCQSIFYNKKELKEHQKQHVSRKQTKIFKIKDGFICEICGLELKSMSLLNRHRLIHTNVLHHSCIQCPYRARTRYALLVHERTHTGIRPLRCGRCPASFSNASNLASHRRTHLPPAYTCDTCNRGFRFREALRNHIATQHTSAKPFYCSVCGKAFSTRKLIRRHELKVHNRPKMRSGITPSYMKLQDSNNIQ